MARYKLIELKTFIKKFSYTSTELTKFKNLLAVNLKYNDAEYISYDLNEKFYHLPKLIWNEIKQKIYNYSGISIDLIDLNQFNELSELIEKIHNGDDVQSLLEKCGHIKNFDNVLKVHISQILSNKNKINLEHRQKIYKYFLNKIIGFIEIEDKDNDLARFLDPYKINDFKTDNDYRRIYLEYLGDNISFNDFLIRYRHQTLQLESLHINTENTFLARHFQKEINKVNNKIDKYTKFLVSLILDKAPLENLFLKKFLFANNPTFNVDELTIPYKDVFKGILFLMINCKINFNPINIQKFIDILDIHEQEKLLLQNFYLVFYQQNTKLNFFNLEKIYKTQKYRFLTKLEIQPDNAEKILNLLEIEYVKQDGLKLYTLSFVEKKYNIKIFEENPIKSIIKEIPNEASSLLANDQNRDEITLLIPQKRTFKQNIKQLIKHYFDDYIFTKIKLPIIILTIIMLSSSIMAYIGFNDKYVNRWGYNISTARGIVMFISGFLITCLSLSAIGTRIGCLVAFLRNPSSKEEFCLFDPPKYFLEKFKKNLSEKSELEERVQTQFIEYIAATGQAIDVENLDIILIKSIASPNFREQIAAKIDVEECESVIN